MLSVNSVHSDTTETAFDEKSTRQGKPSVFPVVLLFSVLFLLSGAGLIIWLFFPFRYSDREVEKYVHSNYGDSWELSEKTSSFDREGGTAQYVYEDESGNSFSVFTYSDRLLRNGVPTGRYRRALTDNYFSAMIKNHLEELEKLAKNTRKKSGPVLEIEKTGQEESLYGSQYVFRLYLEDRDLFSKAAALLESMDKALSFSCKTAEAPYAQMRPAVPFVHVYLKPDKTRVEAAADAISSAAGSRAAGDPALKEQEQASEGEWRSGSGRSSYEISRISFSDGSSPSLSADRLLVRLENDFVDAAKTFGRSYYYISEQLWNKYPSPVLTLINAGGNDLREEKDSADTRRRSRNRKPFTYQFCYHRRTGTYWMTGLDPFEDYDGNPFGEYPRRGAFAGLVRFLGGTSCADRKGGSWKIGSSTWNASVKTVKTVRSPHTYSGVRMTRNGNTVYLDQVPEAFEGTGATPSGRAFSIHDLIRMLGVRITINQREMTAVMFLDTGTAE